MIGRRRRRRPTTGKTVKTTLNLKLPIHLHRPTIHNYQYTANATATAPTLLPDHGMDAVDIMSASQHQVHHAVPETLERASHTLRPDPHRGSSRMTRADMTTRLVLLVAPRTHSTYCSCSHKHGVFMYSVPTAHRTYICGGPSSQRN